MYSTTSPSFCTSCKIDSLMANPNPCWPLAYVPPPSAPLQYTVYPAEVKPFCPARLVFCNPTKSHSICLHNSSISSAWSKLFLPLKAKVRTLNVPAVNSPSRVFNLAALRTARLTRPIFRPFLLFLRAAINRLTFCLIFFLPSFQRVGYSTPDPRIQLPSCP